MPKVSIIVPVYNVEDYLERCLDSLVNQTLEDIEIIVVNDGSPDNSQAIIERYEKKYPNKVKGYIKENGGLSDARNYGMPYAKGEYVAFVDSDDYVELTMYEKLYNEAKAKDSEIVVCGYFKVDEKEKTMQSAQMGNMEFYDQNPRERKEILEINAPYAWNKLVKRELLERTKIQFPKGLLFEDICTMYPLLASANKVSKVNEELYYYIVEREGSITAQFDASKTKILDSIELLNERIEDMGLMEEYRDEIVVINLRHIYFRFKEFDKYKDRKEQVKFVNKAFKILKRHFPDWRTNSGNYTKFTLQERRKKKIWLYKRKWYWLFISIIPLCWVQRIAEYDDYHFVRSNALLKRYYVGLLDKTKVSKNKVLVESFHGKDISDSPYSIMMELLKRKKYKIYVATDELCKDKNKEFIKKNKLKVKLVVIRSKKYYKLLATAKYLVNNVSFPKCLITRDEQIHINTWHGTPLKTLGKNMKKGIESMSNIQHNFLQCDYLLFPNRYTKDCMMEDYNLNQLYTNKTIVSGYPRNTIFCDEEKGKETKRLLGLEDKEVYIYMPTWRGVNSYGAMRTTAIKEILEQFDENLNDNQCMFVNLHPNVGEDIDYSAFKHIDKFPVDVAKYEFINCSDALITDYSSIFFDYSITKKPIVLFMYDYDEYMEDRGMYIDVKSLPFKQIYNIEEMCDSFKDSKILTYRYDDAKDYFDKFTSYDSIDATEKLVDYVFEGKDVGLEVEDYSHNKEKGWNLEALPAKPLEKEELDEIISKCDVDKTIFAVRDIYFHALMNQWFYEEYNDKLTYIVFAYCRMVKEKEEAIFLSEDKKRKPLRRKIKNRARELGYQRSLPNIKLLNKQDNKRLI